MTHRCVRVRAGYREPNARQPPFVLIGDNLAAMRFWDGRLMNDWGERWVGFWTHGRGQMVTSAMEDSGTLVALTYLAKSGRVDRHRVLVLRTGGDFTVPPPERDRRYQALEPGRVGTPTQRSGRPLKRRTGSAHRWSGGAGRQLASSIRDHLPRPALNCPVHDRARHLQDRFRTAVWPG